MTRILTGFVVLLLVILTMAKIAARQSAHVSMDDLLAEEIAPPTARLTYGSDALHFGELRIPSGKGPFPVAILVHGGCWSATLPGLDPRATSYDLLRPMAAALADAGIATWNIEYRRNGNPGGGWPGTFEDIGRATDFLRTIAAKYQLDLSRVIVAGHSSGGHLAMWLAARGKIPAKNPLYSKDPLPLKGAIDIDGPIELTNHQPPESICGVSAIQQFLGGTPAEQPQRYRDATIASYLPTGVPQILLLATFDAPIRADLEAYAAKAKAAGDRFTIVPLKSSNHFDAISPRPENLKYVLDAANSLLR
jgi:acetyl esterase/lipase